MAISGADSERVVSFSGSEVYTSAVQLAVAHACICEDDALQNKTKSLVQASAVLFAVPKPCAMLMYTRVCEDDAL
jgi:hypothetical protein